MHDSQGSLVEMLLAEQQTLTAVQRFAQHHQHETQPAQAKFYHDLIPVGPPKSGQQYAFEVDLDACSGCKSCVTACHALNGLEENEVWRNVGQLIGGTTELPVIQHVTTACHHCIDPACLTGCPVEAYVKDEVTGIVRHLDDQCIGCQYCVLKCPYDVPVYSRSKGIVRKCDMCHHRLEAGEAPACVQSCPNQAIRITIVDQATVTADSEASHFLPAAPDRQITLPTTSYRSSRSMVANLLPADHFAVQRAHGHLPLVTMLVLTQMSVGAFFVDQWVYRYATAYQADIADQVKPLHVGAALFLGLLGLVASIFHLGRPLYAYRAVLGLRTSWLSREIVAFGVFAAAATAYAGTVFVEQRVPVASPATHTRLVDTNVGAAVTAWTHGGEWLGRFAALQNTMGFLAAATGLLAVFCSVMIYVDTRRPCWTLGTTSGKFFLTCLVLGLPTALLVTIFAAGFQPELTIASAMKHHGTFLVKAFMTTMAIKLLLEATQLLALGDRTHTPLRRSAMLMIGQLRRSTAWRFALGLLGGILIPAIILEQPMEGVRTGIPATATAGLALVSIALVTAGELFERFLFFAASVAPKMPGIPAK